MRNLIYYFSATGNTERAVGIVARELEAAGQGATLERIVKGKAPTALPAAGDRVIVAFPALAMTAPAFVRRFMRRALPGGVLPGGERLEAAVLVADGGDCGPAAANAAKRLAKRGYAVVAADRARYAENWAQVGQVPATAEEAARKLAEGDAMAAAFGKALAAGKGSFHSYGPGIRALGGVFIFAFPAAGRFILAKTYIADKSCDTCRLCARTCPAGAIVIGRGKRAKPYWKLSCEDCNRCVNVCPKKAINFSIGRAALIVAAIVAASWYGIAAFEAFVWPGIAPALPDALRGPLLFLIDSIIVLAAHFVGIGPFDALFLHYFQRIPGVDRLLSLSFTKGTGRYRAPGFTPKAER